MPGVSVVRGGAPGAALAALLILLLAGTGAAATAASPNAPLDTPQRLTFEALDHWTMDDVFIYWSNRSDECDVFIPLNQRQVTATSTLKRQPLNGGTTLTLGSEGYCTFAPLAAGSAGVFHEANPGQEQTGSTIVRHARNDPATSTPVATNIDAGATNLVLDGDYVYWSQGNKIYRALQAGGVAVPVASLPSTVMDFVLDGGQIIAADYSNLYFVNPNCGSPPCEADYVTSVAASIVLDGGPGAFAGEFYIVQSATQQLQRLGCSPAGNDWLCTVDVLHDAPVGWHINGLTGICIPGLGGFCNGYSSFFVSEVSDSLTGSRLLRGSGNGPLQEIAIGTNFAKDLFLNDGYVYWAEKGSSPGVYRLPYSAAPLERDLEASAWEVNQVVQNLDNEVPLVAGKETFVIAHGRLLSGPRALSVEAELHGSRGGTPLPGSPLRPTNLPIRLETGGTIDRTTTERSWQFKLPPEWTTSGTLNLTLVVDGRLAYLDTNRNNNSLQGSFSFGDEPDACLFISPVRTHTALPTPQDPIFWQTLQRFQTLWPAEKTQMVWLGEPIEEAEVCWYGPVPYPCSGPYELNQGWELDNFPPDKDRVIMKLIARHALSLTAPLLVGCDIGLLDPTHAVGMVHPDANTTVVDGNSSFTFGGYAWPVVHASWVKFPAHTPPAANVSFAWPHAGGTLAHEVSHNLLRRHVDCGNPDGPDDDYPYSPCKLDDGALDDPDTHFGFDPISRRPVRPDLVADYMAYADYRWASDYTYKAVRSATFLSALRRQAARNELAAADEIVYMSGFYDPDHDIGGLNYAYELAAENLDTVRLAEMFVPSVRDQGPVTLGPTLGISGTLRFRNVAGVLLDEKQVNLVPNEDYGETTGYFNVAFPALTGTVARVQLVVGGQVVAESSPGINPPQVTILEPVAGAVLDQTIRIRWRAVDPDDAEEDLLHTVHYSSDGGQTWIALVTDYADQSNTDEVTLELQSPETVPGSSSQSLIKVATSDGYHTTEVVSAPFTVMQRQPVASISLPLEGTVYDAGREALLMGGAYDAEDGSLTGPALQWRLDGAPAGFGSSLALAGLAPGNYQLSLQATTGISYTNRAADRASSDPVVTTLQIAPLSIPEAAVTPGLDGRCDDAAYAGAARIGLEPYDSGQASASLIRTTTDLWTCFTGLQRGTDSEVGLARLLLDGNYDHTAAVQDGDTGFQIHEDGTPQRLLGVGASGTWQAAADLSGYAAEMTATDTVWQAELRVPLALVNASGPEIALLLSHSVEGPGTSAWPYDSSYLTPSSWAQAILGEQPRLDSIDPHTVASGASALELTLNGRNFADDAVALWDGVPLQTAVVSPTQLTATVSAGLLDTAGEFPVAVRNPDLPDLPSETRSLVVLNAVPTLTSLTPEQSEAGSSSFMLTVKGSGFVPGAVVYWDGEARPTSYVSGGELQASISQGNLGAGGQVGISVRNPEPSAGQSATLFFTITPGEIQRILYMPAVIGGR